MNACPECYSDDIVILGVLPNGWAIDCRTCGCQWTETDRIVELGR